MEQHSHRLFGSWYLLSAQLELADSKERIDLFGPHPVGRVIFAGNGRMAGVITARNRTPASDATGVAALFGSMTAFSGMFRFEDDAKVVIDCDVAGNPSWAGTEQVRFYEFSGDRLTLTAGPQAHPMYPGRDVYVIIEWQQEV